MSREPNPFTGVSTPSLIEELTNRLLHFEFNYKNNKRRLDTLAFLLQSFEQDTNSPQD